MILSPVLAFTVSFFVFIFWVVLTRVEAGRGRRIFARNIRSRMDTLVVGTGEFLLKKWNHFVRYIVQLHWYYGLHSVLRAILQIIVKFYSYFEDIFEQNRKRTKELRAEKRQVNEMNHLQQMAVHKEDTALTSTQKRKLRQKKLEEKH